jgi:single-strand DNA-binding protein
MARSINKVILVGNLGKDPEVRKLENGVSVASFTLATSETFRDRNTNEPRTQTEWHNIVVWRGLADVAEKYLKKGMQIYLEGKLRTRSYQDKDGNTKYTTEIVGDNVVMMSRGPGGENQSSQSAGANTGTETNFGTATFNEPEATDDLPF